MIDDGFNTHFFMFAKARGEGLKSRRGVINHSLLTARDDGNRDRQIEKQPKTRDHRTHRTHRTLHLKTLLSTDVILSRILLTLPIEGRERVRRKGNNAENSHESKSKREDLPSTSISGGQTCLCVYVV